jgi:iron(III) transport system substrate-binding protein
MQIIRNCTICHMIPPLRFGRSVRSALAGALLVVGLSPAAAAQSVNLYTARHYDGDEKIYERFTALSGIKVNVIAADADKLIERMRAESANSPADLLITVDAGRLWRAQEAGLLQPVQSEALARVPEHLRDPQGYWYAISKRVRLFVYNKQKVAASDLRGYEELADSKWRGRVLVRSSSNIYNQSLIGSYLATHGLESTEQWARNLTQNFARSPKGGDLDQIRAVAAGEGDVAIVNHYYVAQLVYSQRPDAQEAARKIAVAFPNQDGRGAHVNISGAGLAKNAPNREAAIKLLEFLLSPEAQTQIAKGNYEYPVIPGVAVDPLLASWGEFREDRLNAAVFGRNNEAALKLADRVGWR